MSKEGEGVWQDRKEYGSEKSPAGTIINWFTGELQHSPVETEKRIRKTAVLLNNLADQLYGHGWESGVQIPQNLGEKPLLDRVAVWAIYCNKMAGALLAQDGKK